MTGVLLPAALGLLAFCVGVETVQQLSFKVGADRAGRADNFVRGVVTQPLIWMGIGDFLFPVVVFGGAWLAGRLVRQRDVHIQVAEERSAALAREREANVRAASAEERARIAERV